MTVKGRDVSSFQGLPDWQQVKAHGDQFAFCKASEGVTYADSSFAHNWHGIQAAGLVRGAYHFARPQPFRSGRAEADHFLAVIAANGGVRVGDLLALDVEASSTGYPAALSRRFVTEFFARLRQRVPHVTGGTYSAQWWWGSHVGGRQGGRFRWVASYPNLITPDAWGGWEFHQYTDREFCPGIGDCDTSVFNGTVAELHQLAGGDVKPGPPRTLREGDTGPDVRVLQSELNRVRSRLRQKAVLTNGTFDQHTASRLREFQAHHKLKADGVCGPASRRALEQAVRGRRPPPKPKPAPKPPTPKPPPKPSPKPTPKPQPKPAPGHYPAGLPETMRKQWDVPWRGHGHYAPQFLGWLLTHGHLSPHFTLAEAACHDGTPVPASLHGNAQRHAFQLERLRHALGDVPIPNDSWYRTQQHNRQVGGAADSRHLHGDATDHSWGWVDHVGRGPVEKAVERLFADDGVGMEGAGHALHVDSRGRRARWITWTPVR